MAKTLSPLPLAISPLFKIGIWINCALCLGTFSVMIAVAFSGQDPMPKAMERLAIVCEHVFTLTSGAFVGLLAGRGAMPDPKGTSHVQ